MQDLFGTSEFDEVNLEGEAWAAAATIPKTHFLCCKVISNIIIILWSLHIHIFIIIHFNTHSGRGVVLLRLSSKGDHLL